jgi:hypothetical protein
LQSWSINTFSLPPRLYELRSKQDAALRATPAEAAKQTGRDKNQKPHIDSSDGQLQICSSTYAAV